MEMGEVVFQFTALHSQVNSSTVVMMVTVIDENFAVKHDKPYLLSMANCGPNTNGSQFFITLVPTPHLNEYARGGGDVSCCSKHVVFGEVVSGQQVVDSIALLKTDDNDKPLIPVVIGKSGELVLKQSRM